MDNKSKHLLFYSNFCSFSNEIVDKITKHSLSEKFLLINISKVRFKIPTNITTVPTVLLNDKRTIYTDKDLEDFLEKLAEKNNKDIDAFTPFNSISSNYSFVDSFEEQNDSLTKNFGLIHGEQNISTPTENAERSKEKLVDKMSSIEQNRNMDIQNIYKDMKQK
jgi:hypothetical protein